MGLQRDISDGRAGTKVEGSGADFKVVDVGLLVSASDVWDLSRDAVEGCKTSGS